MINRLIGAALVFLALTGNAWAFTATKLNRALDRDPNFANTLFLLKGNGAAGTGTFTDILGHTVTPENGTVNGGSQSKFYSTSILIDSATKALSVGSPFPTAFGTGPFTMEFWIYPNNFSAYGFIMDTRSSGATGQWLIDLSTSGVITFDNPVTAINTASTALSTGQWYHICIMRSGTTTNLFINGVQKSTYGSDSTSYTGGALYIGGSAYVPGSSGIGAYLQEIRFSNITRYSMSGFTPPSAPFPTH